MTKEEAEARDIRHMTNIKVFGFWFRWALIYLVATGVIRIELIEGIAAWIR